MDTFLQTIYPIAKILSPIFFGFINFLFECYYFFQSRQIVPSPEDELLLLSVTDAAELIRQRKLTSTKLISAYISRIKLVNPIINAVVEDNFVEAIKEAKEVDKYLDSLDDSSNEYKMVGIKFKV
uniref:Uncharacterized protein n=1 Tax=Panagrolaimus davidi TaxID=227884 RepID=A0A914PVX0_9BILA